MALSKIKAPSIADGSITVDQIADTAVYGRRNLFQNGAMQVAQRSTSVSVSGTGFTYPTVDRIKYGRSYVDDLVATMSQSTDAPDEFKYSLKWDVTTAETAKADNEYVRFTAELEGRDLQHFQYGKSTAQDVTVSFWCKSNKTGTYALASFRNETQDRMIVKNYTINTANTWEKKEITFEGDTSDAITSDSNGRWSLQWYLLAGSNFTTSGASTWIDYSASYFASGHTVDWGMSTDDDFYFTGLQIEVGDKASPYEHRSYGEDLLACQRYFFALTQAGNANDQAVAQGAMYNSTLLTCTTHFPVEMRAEPTLDHATGTNYYKFYRNGSGDDFNGFSTIASPNRTTASLDANANLSGTAGHGGRVKANNVNATLSFDAEF